RGHSSGMGVLDDRTRGRPRPILRAAGHRSRRVRRPDPDAGRGSALAALAGHRLGSPRRRGADGLCLGGSVRPCRAPRARAPGQRPTLPLWTGSVLSVLAALAGLGRKITVLFRGRVGGQRPGLPLSIAATTLALLIVTLLLILTDAVSHAIVWSFKIPGSAPW